MVIRVVIFDLDIAYLKQVGISDERVVTMAPGHYHFIIRWGGNVEYSVSSGSARRGVNTERLSNRAGEGAGKSWWIFFNENARY